MGLRAKNSDTLHSKGLGHTFFCISSCCPCRRLFAVDWGEGPSALGKKLSRACAPAVLVQVEHVYTAKIALFCRDYRVS